MKLIKKFKELADSKENQEYTMEDFLGMVGKDDSTYINSAERMLRAIGEPEFVDTSNDPRESRIFSNKIIRRYAPFSDFYGMEDTIERIVGFFKHAAQGLEESKQVLYLLGPVGSAKSSLAERLKALMEENPIYVLADENGNPSPVFEHPFGLFSEEEYADEFEKMGVPSRYLKYYCVPSPWALKRLKEYDQDISRFKVLKMWPSKLNRVGIVKTEPGDENNQDISSLVGKVDIRQLEFYSQSDPDAYSCSGGLCRGNQGMLEFVEMFKAPIKVLHPLLTATQEGNYNATEDGVGAFPFQGTVLAHSNESEWVAFKNNKNNEAFIDRVYIVKVPYCLRRSDEVKIYKKMLAGSSLKDAVCAPKTLELLADFSILTRLKEHTNSTQTAKMFVYDGENMKDRDPKAKSILEYKDAAGVDEGMSGMSTRFAFKVLSQTFNYDTKEIAADPVHMMMTLERAIKQEQFDEEKEKELLSIIKDYMFNEYAEFIQNEIQRAYIESYSDFGQAIFDRYYEYADHWTRDIDYKDPDTGQLFDREMLNNELTKIEKPAGIANPKDFRSEIVNFILRARANNNGQNPKWSSYRKLKEVIEQSVFSKMEDILPVISFESKAKGEDDKKHKEFVERMKARGYTLTQIQRLVQWYKQVRKAS